MRVVAAGDALITPKITRRLIERFALISQPSKHTAGVLQALTDREREVLVQVATGYSNTEIGERLYISQATVKTHIGRLLLKLNARDRAQLVMAAYEHGLVYPGA